VRTTTRQANFTLPDDLLEDLRRTVPKGEQSKVVGEALRNDLARIKFRQVMEQSKTRPSTFAGQGWRGTRG
jgi:Arc/MetJ-type ribon-helix-helix transcriptional regulator